MRMADPLLADLPGNEQRQQPGGGDQPTERAKVAPAMLLGVDETPDEREQHPGQQCDPGWIKATALGLIARLSHHPTADDQRHGSDEDIDDEDPTPTGVIDQHAADNRAGGDPE